MKQRFVLWMGIAMLAVAGCSAQQAGSQPEQTTPNATQPAVKASGDVVAEARVVPERYAALSVTASGVVVEVSAKEGDRVDANQMILRLDAKRQTAGVAQAEAALKRAQARLDELKAGPRPQEVESAKAALDAALAQLAKLEQGARQEDVAAAQASVVIAQAQLQQVKDGASQEQLEAAQADFANAEAVLKLRQADYDRVAYEPGVGARPESIALEQATNTFRSAKARYDELAKGPTAPSLALAQARVHEAAARLNGVRATPRQADIDALQAEIHRAQAQLDLVQAGARPETIAAAQADVDAAQASLDQANATLAETELRAPFAGVIASLDVHVGEQVALGTIVARIGDPSMWVVETTDLTELSIVDVREGSKAVISFDALPGVQLPGKVVRIKQFGENKQGDITYTVVVQPDTQDERLRWNMTASVSIEP